MDWKPKFETVVQISQREFDLYARKDVRCVFHKYRHPVPKGIHHSGEFPVAVIRFLYKALGYQTWFSGQSKSGRHTYLLTRLPGKRREDDAAYVRMKRAFGADVIGRFDKAAEELRRENHLKTAGGDPDLFVFHRADPKLRFFVEVKLETFTLPYRDDLGEQQRLLFPLIEKLLDCPVRIARVQVVDVA
jgi:hypothetical protein